MFFFNLVFTPKTGQVTLGGGWKYRDAGPGTVTCNRLFLHDYIDSYASWTGVSWNPVSLTPNHRAEAPTKHSEVHGLQSVLAKVAADLLTALRYQQPAVCLPADAPVCVCVCCSRCGDINLFSDTVRTCLPVGEERSHQGRNHILEWRLRLKVNVGLAGG